MIQESSIIIYSDEEDQLPDPPEFMDAVDKQNFIIFTDANGVAWTDANGIAWGFILEDNN